MILSTYTFVTTVSGKVKSSWWTKGKCSHLSAQKSPYKLLLSQGEGRGMKNLPAWFGLKRFSFEKNIKVQDASLPIL